MQTTSNIPFSLTTKRNTLMFLIPSLLGIFLFMTPIKVDGNFTIPIAALAKFILAHLGDHTSLVITSIVTVSALASILAPLIKPLFITRSKFLSSLLLISPAWLIVRLLGSIFVLMAYFNVGPEHVLNPGTGIFVLNDLLPTLLSVFLFAGLFLPLLTNFGLLELIGTLMTRIMRPLFGLPGRSAVDCASSWLGDGSVAILMSSKQYEQGYYTEKEAAIVGTTFSIVSISFSLVVIAQVGLEHMFIPFYLTVCLSGFITAIIMPRIPPLSWKKNTLITGKERTVENEMIPENETVFSYSYKLAIARASKIRSISDVLQEGIQNAIDMIFGVLPVVMAIGTATLIIAEYTPIFTILGMPFVPLLELLRIPEAVAASGTILVGIADMFIPSVLGANIDNEMTRFVIASLSVTQLIYMSEVGALLLGSKIPVKIWELLVIFLLRTLISLPIIAAVAHLIF